MYEVGFVVYVMKDGLPFTNGKIIGYEWGGDYKTSPKNEWLYWIQDYQLGQGSQAFPVFQSEVHGRISV